MLLVEMGRLKNVGRTSVPCATSKMKETQLRIRCSEDAKKKFRMFVAKYGCSDYEDALLELLRLAERHPDLVKVRWG